MNSLFILAMALVLDRLLGEPDWLWSKVRHPIVVVGNAIGWLDERFNRETLDEGTRAQYGARVILGLVVVALSLGILIELILHQFGVLGVIIEIIIVAILLAWRSLIDHVRAVACGLRDDGIGEGRRAVGLIVGRDPEQLDAAGVSRAAIESLAENTSDGIVAPAFWFVVFGVPGLLAYKVINTADSMIGHRTTRHDAFGRLTAQIDDVVNFVPARFTAIMFAFAGGSWSTASQRLRKIFDDAGLHRSPNAGWPESAMAASLEVALGGPRIYADDVADEPFMNAEGDQNASASDIDTAITIVDRCLMSATILCGLSGLLIFLM